MTKYKCEKCGTTLLLGKGKLNVGWCPSCEGVEVENVVVSKNHLVSEFKDISSRILHVMKQYEKESLLISAYITRESELHSEVPDLPYFIGISELINLVMSFDQLGNKQAVWNEDGVQELYHLAERANMDKKIISLLQNDWIRFIRIRKSELRTYCYDLENSLKADEKNFEELDGDDWVTELKFTYQWKEVLENLSANGIIAKNEAHFGVFSSAKVPLLDEFWDSIRTKISLEQSTGNRELLEFPDLKDSVDTLRAFERMTIEFPFYYSAEKNVMGRVTSFELKPILLIQFYNFFLKEGFDLNAIDHILSYLASNRKKGFPLLLSTSKGLFIGPQTLVLVSRLLKAKYFREYLDRVRDVGREFEDQVVKELEKYQFLVYQPNDKNKKMVNVLDDTQKPTLEIDIIAYKNDEIYLIECKHLVFTTEFIVRNRNKHLGSILSQEPEKMKRRASFLSENLERFGFNRNKAYDLKLVYVTFNVEPIKEFLGIRIIPLRDLRELDASQKKPMVRFFTISELLANLPFHQYAMSKAILETNENACMICGDEPTRQLLMNGYPIQVCEDCIEIQEARFGSSTEEVL